MQKLHYRLLLAFMHEILHKALKTSKSCLTVLRVRQLE